MRICLVTPEFPPMQGGVGDYTSRLARTLANLDLDVQVLTSSKGKSRSGEQVVFENALPFIEEWSFSCWGPILASISRFKPDVLHIQYQTAGYAMHPAINLLPARIGLVKGRPRVVVTFHDLKVPYLFPKAGAIRRLPALLMAGHCDGVIATNVEDHIELCRHSLTRRLLAAARNRRAFRVFPIPIGSNIPNLPPPAFEREAWRRRLGLAPGETLLAYFGFLNRTKGVDVLFDAYFDLRRSGFQSKLIMVGGSYGDSDPTNVDFGRSLRATVEASPYHSDIIWTGFTSQEEVSANLLASDLCVLPFDEGASLRHGTLMAAIAHEMPIITTRMLDHQPQQSCFPNLERAVQMVPPRDVTALAAAIRELAVSPLARVELGKAVGQLASAFDWRAIGNAHISVYDSILGTTGQRG